MADLLSKMQVAKLRKAVAHITEACAEILPTPQRKCRWRVEQVKNWDGGAIEIYLEYVSEEDMAHDHSGAVINVGEEGELGITLFK